MMIFGEDEKVIVGTMTETEAKDYIRFLEFERNQHHKRTRIYVEKMIDGETETYLKFLVSAIKRHYIDVDECESTMEYTREVFKI